MQDHERHGLRNFLLFTITLALVTFLWKERERLQEKLRDLEDKLEDALVSEPEGPSDIVELDRPAPQPEPEPIEEVLEPALLTPLKEEAAAEVAEQIIETQEPIPEDELLLDNHRDEPADDQLQTDDIFETDDSFETESIIEEIIADEPVFDEPVEDGPPTWVSPVDGECPEGFPVKARYATGHFHVPGDRGYKKISPDCCYPSVETAEADGFTPSRWT